MKKINLAFSPCPNDTFVFYALVHDKIDTEGFRFEYMTADVEALNQLAATGFPDMVKVSYHAWLYFRYQYDLLRSGSALGFGNGPLLISAKKIPTNDLAGKVIAIPGEFTTAHLLLKFFTGGKFIKKIKVFSEIEDAVLHGEADAGVIIHENRFTYAKKGLIKLADLGEYWQDKTGSAIPLGGIIARKDLGSETVTTLDRILRRSVEWAFSNPDETMEFVRKHAQEMDEEVMRKHIALYVNQFTIDLGSEGEKAIRKLSEYEAQFTRE
ncbi:MAG: 1,4-dihydroxy-6-naphthoate synthase [Syntrophothermus sp.]